MKYKKIKCPFCEKVTAEVTYEENRIYKLICFECSNAILHKDHSWDSAVRFFERILIVEEGRTEDGIDG